MGGWGDWFPNKIQIPQQQCSHVPKSNKKPWVWDLGKLSPQKSFCNGSPYQFDTVWHLFFCCVFIEKSAIKTSSFGFDPPPLTATAKKLLPLEFVWRLFGICDQSSQLSPNLSKARASHNPGFTIRKVSSFKLIQLFYLTADSTCRQRSGRYFCKFCYEEAASLTVCI